MVDNKAGVLRLQFLPLTLAQEEELTRVLYSRADSWLSSAAERERDRPLKSLGLLAKLSVRGVAAALSNFGRSKQPEETADVEKPETPPEKPPETPSKVNSMAGTAVILFGCNLLAFQSCACGATATIVFCRGSQKHPKVPPATERCLICRRTIGWDAGSARRHVSYFQ